MNNTALKLLEAEFVEPVQEWADIETSTALKPLPEFPLDTMPGVLQDMTVEISKSVQIQPETAGLALLIITAAAAGRENIFQVRKGLNTRPNFFGLVFVERGGRKSSAYSPAMKPVYQWIQERLPEYQRALGKYHLKLREREALETKIIKPGNTTRAADELRHEALQGDIAAMKADLRDPSFTADDCTPEGLFELFERTQGQTAIVTDDGRTFAKITTGIYNNGETREDIHLKGFDCNNPITKHRAGKSSVMIEKPFESALVMLQVDYLSKFAKSEDLFQSGFMSRCIFCYPDSVVGTREYSEREILEPIFQEYSDLIIGLLDRNYSRKINEDVWYELEPEAKTLWIDYYNKNEQAIGAGGELFHMCDVAIRFPEFCRKFALIAAIVEGRDTITIADMERAIILTDYFQAHAERAFAVMRKISLPEEARRILKTIKKNSLQEFSIRVIESQNGMKAEEIQAGIITLASRNYCRLKADQPEPSGVGRRPSPVYESNPEIWEKD